MRIPIWLTILAALVGLAMVVAVGSFLFQPPRPLITAAAAAPETISPNADGVDDVTVFRYGLSRAARVSLALEAEGGTVFFFRQDEPRIPWDYQVAFSGVVDGYTLPGETLAGTVERRLIPDGRYTWRLTATDEAGQTDERSGVLTVEGGDLPLPELTEFSVQPGVFTPNQDGISDRVMINVFLTQPADLNVFLLNAQGVPVFIPPRLEEIRQGEAGRHDFDYEGGVDQNADPPPDGVYTLVAEAQDAVGQRVRREAELRVEEGGRPIAQILTQPNGVSVVFEPRAWEARFQSRRDAPGALIDPPADPDALTLTTITLPVGDLLTFKLTVENTGDVPVRTTGPAPGTVYEWNQAESTLGYFEEAGAWRVGIDCTTAPRDYPWRWAIGDAESLVERDDPVTGNTYRYLMPGERSIVWGAVRMTDLEVFNPQNCWAGLIHEQVRISEFNANVGARQIELVEPEAAADG